MYWPLFQTILLLSAAACALLWARRPVRPAFGYVGAAGWIIVTLQARNIEIFHQDGSSTVVGSEAAQFFAAGLAMLTLATIVLYYLGVYPPTTDPDAGAAEIQNTEPEMTAND